MVGSAVRLENGTFVVRGASLGYKLLAVDVHFMEGDVVGRVVADKRDLACFTIDVSAPELLVFRYVVLHNKLGTKEPVRSIVEPAVATARAIDNLCNDR